MATQLNYSNTAPPVTLSVGVNTSAIVLTTASTAGYPPAPFLLGLERGTANEEVVLCTSVAGTTFTVQRGYDGTTAKAHELGSSIEHTVAAIDYRQANQHVNTPHNIGNALPVPAAPVDSNPGDTAATGSAVEPARADHRHRRESFGNPVTSSPGDVMSQGASSNVARSDHVHPRESYAQIADNVLPAGVIVPYAGFIAPTTSSSIPGAPAWLLPWGQAVSRSTFARLFNLFGTTFGAGDGATTFNMPDLRGRTVVGLDNMGNTNAGRVSTAFGITALTLGGALGEALHTLTVGEMPSHSHGNDAHNHSQNAHTHGQDAHNHGQNPHSHGVNDPAHHHGPEGNGYQFVIASAQAEQHYVPPTPGPGGNTQVTYSGMYNNTTGISIQSTVASNQAATINIYTAVATNNASTINIQNTGGGGSHNTMQPSIMLGWLIKT